MNEDGTMARVPELAEIAERHHLKMITIKDLIEYRYNITTLVNREVASGRLLFLRLRGKCGPDAENRQTQILRSTAPEW